MVLRDFCARVGKKINYTTRERHKKRGLVTWHEGMPWGLFPRLFGSESLQTSSHWVCCLKCLFACCWHVFVLLACSPAGFPMRIEPFLFTFLTLRRGKKRFEILLGFVVGRATWHVGRQDCMMWLLYSHSDQRWDEMSIGLVKVMWPSYSTGFAIAKDWSV